LLDSWDEFNFFNFFKFCNVVIDLSAGWFGSRLRTTEARKKMNGENMYEAED